MNVQMEHIIVRLMQRVITLLVHSFVHVITHSKEMERIVKVTRKRR